MPKDLSDVDEPDSLTPRQNNLLLWRDYFELLQQGLDSDKMGDSDNPWTEEKAEVAIWLDVAMMELEADVLHIECGQEKYCRFDEPKPLSTDSPNIES